MPHNEPFRILLVDIEVNFQNLGDKSHLSVKGFAEVKAFAMYGCQKHTSALNRDL